MEEGNEIHSRNVSDLDEFLSFFVQIKVGLDVISNRVQALKIPFLIIADCGVFVEGSIEIIFAVHITELRIVGSRIEVS